MRPSAGQKGREGGNRQDPFANPLLADLKGFPSIYIQTRADETLLDDSRKLADLARNSGWMLHSRLCQRCSTCSNSSPGAAPEGDAAIHRLADWVRPKLGSRKGLLCAAISR